MKKTKFYIAVYDPKKHGQTAKPVNGYFEYVCGLPLGFHKGTGKKPVWTVTELSTGLKIADGNTRENALERAMPLLDMVCKRITEDKVRPLREMIDAAYAG